MFCLWDMSQALFFLFETYTFEYSLTFVFLKEIVCLCVKHFKMLFISSNISFKQVTQVTNFWTLVLALFLTPQKMNARSEGADRCLGHYYKH